MKTMSRFASLLAMAAFLIPAGPARADGDPVNGKALFTANCNSCHKLGALDAARAGANDPAAIQNALSTVPDMAGLKGFLSATQIADIAAYIGTVVSGGGGGGAVNYQGLWWNAPANSESGWGVNLAHQGDTIFASWFTYDTSGKGWWLVVTATKTATNTYSGKLYSTRGPAFNATPWDPTAVAPTEQGSATFTFSDANNGTFQYVIGAIDRTKTITREVFGTLPTCTFGAVADLTTATNYQDLWWKKPANTESGWGINLNHEGDTIFATWFTYDLDGSPLWLVVTANKTGPGAYGGDLYRTSGARFDAFKPGDVVATKVGSAKFTVVDGNTITFEYTVQLAGMASPVSQSRTITREIFTAPGTTCR
jgi:hypothetical protein